MASRAGPLPPTAPVTNLSAWAERRSRVIWMSSGAGFGVTFVTSIKWALVRVGKGVADSTKVKPVHTSVKGRIVNRLVVRVMHSVQARPWHIPWHIHARCMHVGDRPTTPTVQFLYSTKAYGHYDCKQMVRCMHLGKDSGRI
jgi:hypothetical protein